MNAGTKKKTQVNNRVQYLRMVWGKEINEEIYFS